PALAVGLHIGGEVGVGQHRDVAEHIVEDVRLLQVVQLIRLADELARDEAAVGQVVEDDLVRHQPRHADHGPAGQGLKLGVDNLEIGNAARVQVQSVQAAHEGLAGAARQDGHLPLVQGVPGLVFDLGIAGPVLRDGPVGGGAFWRLLENVLEVGHGNAPHGSDGLSGQISAPTRPRHARLLPRLRDTAQRKRKRAGGFPPTRFALKAVSGDPKASSEILLDFDLGAGFFQLLLQLFSSLLRDVLDDRLRSAFDQVLGFLQTQVGADAADFLDDVDLLVAAVNQDNGELGLLFAGRSGFSSAGDSGDGDRSSGRN